jgi:cytochrome c6
MTRYATCPKRAVAIALLLAAWLPCTGAAADVMQGRNHYETYCRNCHGDDGRGVIAGAPDFSRGQGLMKPDAALVSGLKTARGGMPSFQGILRDQQILDVVAFLRTLQR